MDLAWYGSGTEDACWAGLTPTNKSGWRFGVGRWTQASGTVEFAVLRNVDANSEQRVAFRLQNRAIAQPARIPSVTVCSIGRQTIGTFRGVLIVH
eukprot:1641773-Rhodomonas_salina.1